MKTARASLTQAEIRASAQAWYDRQLTLLAKCHGADWPKHEAWVKDYLKAELRQRLLELGWRPR